MVTKLEFLSSGKTIGYHCWSTEKDDFVYARARCHEMRDEIGKLLRLEIVSRIRYNAFNVCKKSEKNLLSKNRIHANIF